MTFQLPSLPYALDALEPHVSARTLEIHHGRHHRGYVEKLNRLVDKAGLRGASLEELIRTQRGPLFDNAAQAWNHAFYWNSMSPSNEAPRASHLAAAIVRDFGDLETLEKRFKEAAAGVFGSGWAWLVQGEQGRLAIETTSNADCPLRTRNVPLLTCDVWEHAYYLDYQNERARYLDAWWNVVNWRFVEQNYRAEAFARL